tara:strand:- start:371 stop:712 length:342 start_codon:yes stop_codon:yes gene_type:complete
MSYKKLDEVMELLNDELDGFNQSISKLEKLTENVDNINIKADTSAIEYYLKDHLRTEKEKSQKLHEAFQRMEKQLSKSRVIPKVQLWIHYGIYSIALIIIGYLIFKLTWINGT